MRPNDGRQARPHDPPGQALRVAYPRKDRVIGPGAIEDDAHEIGIENDPNPPGFRERERTWHSFHKRATPVGLFSALTGTNPSTKSQAVGTTRIRGESTKMVSESSVYLPEELSLLGKVLDEVVQSLPPNLRTPYNRIEIARNILACAATGERAPDVLRRAALMDSTVAVAA